MIRSYNDGADDTPYGEAFDAPCTCEWFALCPNSATGTEPHPILGEVPICDRCREWCRQMGQSSRRPGWTGRMLGDSRDN